MSPKVQRYAQLFSISGGVIAILLTLLFLTITPHNSLHAAPPQAQHPAIAQTASITGQVTAEDSGAPLAGIEVVAFPREVADEQNSVSAATDATGQYELPGLRAGTYKVCFGPFQIDERYLSECYDNRPLEADDEQLVTVTDGEVLPNISAVLTLGGVIQGRITSGRTGEPLPNIPLYASRLEQYYVGRAHTDDNGAYKISGLPTGNYKVSFNTGSDAREIYAREYYDNNTTEEESDPVSVTAGITTSGIDAELSFILNITGQIEYKTPRQYSLDISVYDITGAKVSGYVAESNAYTVTGLAPGAYRLRFGENEYVNEYYSDSPTFEGATWITVTENVVVGNVNVSLMTARPHSDLSFATAATRPDAIFATRTNGSSTIYILDGFSPLYTLDGGQSWHTFATKPTDNFQYVRFIALAPKDDEAEPVRFLLAPNGSPPYPTTGVFRSADEGANWANYNPPDNPQCDGDPVNVIEGLTSSAADPLRMYFLVRCAKTFFSIEPTYRFYFTLYTSTDGGVSWQAATLPYSQDAPFHVLKHNFKLQSSPADPLRLYVNAERFDQPYLLYRSDNAGQSWITETFTTTALALDWTDASKLYWVEDQLGSNVFRYTGKRSTDTGASWEDWPQQPCRTSFLQLLTLPTADTLLMLCNQGLYRSNNRGDSWELLTAETGGRLAVHHGDRDLVLWGREGDIYGSRDQGTSWQDFGGWQDAYLPNIQQP